MGSGGASPSCGSAKARRLVAVHVPVPFVLYFPWEDGLLLRFDLRVLLPDLARLLDREPDRERDMCLLSLLVPLRLRRLFGLREWS